MTLVERDSELAFLKKSAVDAAHGTASVVLISGPVASGKTSLLRELSAFAADSGLLVVDIQCPQGGQGTPLGALCRLFRTAPLPPEWAERVEAALATGRSAAQNTADGSRDADDVPVHVVNDLHAALRALTVTAPVLITVDDLQNADSASLRFLPPLVDRLRSAPVMLALGEREGPHAAHPLFRAELLRQPHYRRVAIDLLSPGGVRQMVSHLLDEASAHRLSPVLHDVSGGNPLLVRALVDDHEATRNTLGPRAVDAGPADESFLQALLWCLERTEPQTRAVAHAVAVLDDAATVELLARLAGSDTEPVARHVQTLNRTGLLDGLRFRHPEARAAVLAGLHEKDRAALRLDAARLLYYAGEPATKVAAHLLAAGSAGEPWALKALAEAAKEAGYRGQTQVRGQYLKLAYEECRDERHKAELLVKLVDTEFWASPPASVRRMLQLLESPLAAHMGTRQASLIARHLFWLGRPREAVKVLDSLDVSALAHDESASLDVHTTQLLLDVSWPSLGTRALAVEDLGPSALPQSSPVSIVFRSTKILDSVLREGPLESSIEQAEEILRNPWQDNSLLDAVANALITLIYSDRTETAAEHCDRILSELAQHNLRGGQAYFTAIRSWIALRQGDVSAAYQSAQVSLALIPPHHWGMAVGLPLAVGIFAATAMGNYAEAERLSARPLPDSLLESRFGLHYLRARGHLHLAMKRPTLALDDFLVSGERVQAWGMDLPTLAPWRVDAAEAHLALGRPEEAGALLAEQLDRLGQAPSRVHGMALRLLAEADGPERRVSLLTRAVDMLRACGDRYELARALADLQQTRQKRPSSPQAPVRGGGIETLTKAETRVAELAAQGRTNREIARRLQVTPSTVEQHLTRVFRKLNLTDRNQLAAPFAA
ncbi:AAA family ATPase [Streptomyces sp. NPDC002476]|uniref:AAA family ATPase n=1 Tax=Streptomyces sp. NPDC002476 TaxID=3364648 RepID=UPI003677AA08